MIIYPTMPELILALELARKESEWQHPEDHPLDVRLQCTEDGWELHTGDPSYDTDHRGVWGASEVCPEHNTLDLEWIANCLLGECKEASEQ